MSDLQDAAPPWDRSTGLRLALVAASALAAWLARRVVAADDLPDLAELALTLGTLLLIAASFAAALRLRPRSPLAPARQFTAGAVPIALALIAAVFVARSYADTCIEAESLLAATQPSGAETVVPLGPRGDDVRLAGEIRPGAAKRLAALLDAHPQVTRIHLTSEGGLADEGQDLGAIIAAHGLTTYVPDYCVSACTLAFVAGRERWAMRDARIGFHAPFAEGVFGQTFRGDPDGARRAYLDAGLDAAFVDEALDVAADDMWYPEPSRLIEAHVVTAFVDRDRLPDSNLDTDPTVRGARETVLRNFPVLGGLAAASPMLVERIADWYLEAYRHEWSEGRVVAGLHALSDSAVALTISGADDRALVDVARFLDQAMRAADLRDCQAIGGRGDIVTATKVLGRDAPEAGKAAADLISAALRGPPRTAAARDRAAPLLVAYRPDATPRSCGDLRRAFEAALAQPLPQAARLLRPRFTEWARRSVVPLAAAISEPER